MIDELPDHLLEVVFLELNLRKLNMKKILLISFALFFLYACSFTAQEYQKNLTTLLQTAKDDDYGNKPTETEIKVLELVHKTFLKDPDSAKFIWGKPYKCDFPSKNSKTIPVLGWCIDMECNAKNSFGAYTGYKWQLIRIKDGSIYSICKRDQELGWLICS